MENSLNIKNLKFSKNKHKGKHKRKYYLNSKNINKDENQESQSILSNNLNENEIIKKNVIEVNQCNNRLEEDLVTPSMKIIQNDSGSGGAKDINEIEREKSINIDIKENYVKDFKNEKLIEINKKEEPLNEINSEKYTSYNDLNIVFENKSVSGINTDKKENEIFLLDYDKKQIENVIDINLIFSNESKSQENKKNIENLKEENSQLGKLNEILEREINLLKSLILINNLNSTNNNERDYDQRQYYNKNYFIEMCNDNNLQELVQDDGLFRKHKTLHMLMIKIKNIREQLDLFRKEFEEDRSRFLELMNDIHYRVIDYFNKEIKTRRIMEEKVSSIKKLI